MTVMVASILVLAALLSLLLYYSYRQRSEVGWESSFSYHYIITLLKYNITILHFYIIIFFSMFKDKILSSTIYATKPHYIKIWKYFKKFQEFLVHKLNLSEIFLTSLKLCGQIIKKMWRWSTLRLSTKNFLYLGKPLKNGNFHTRWGGG